MILQSKRNCIVTQNYSFHSYFPYSILSTRQSPFPTSAVQPGIPLPGNAIYLLLVSHLSTRFQLKHYFLKEDFPDPPDQARVSQTLLALLFHILAFTFILIFRVFFECLINNCLPTRKETVQSQGLHLFYLPLCPQLKVQWGAQSRSSVNVC